MANENVAAPAGCVDRFTLYTEVRALLYGAVSIADDLDESVTGVIELCSLLNTALVRLFDLQLASDDAVAKGEA